MCKTEVQHYICFFFFFMLKNAKHFPDQIERSNMGAFVSQIKNNICLCHNFYVAAFVIRTGMKSQVIAWAEC